MKPQDISTAEVTNGKETAVINECDLAEWEKQGYKPAAKRGRAKKAAKEE